MSTDRPLPKAAFDRLADAWLTDGPTELADRVLDAALREVHQTHQRRRVAPWRFPQMSILSTGLAGRAIGVAAAVAVALGALSLLAMRPGPVGQAPSPSAPSTSTPASATPPRQSSSTAIPIGLITGTYTTRVLTPATTFTVAAGWANRNENTDILHLWKDSLSYQLTIARILGDPLVYARPNPSYSIDAPVATTLAGLPAQRVSFVLAQDAPRKSGGTFQLASLPETDTGRPVGFFGPNSAGTTCRLWIVQVGGAQVVILAQRPTGDTSDFDQQVDGILTSMSFN